MANVGIDLSQLKKFEKDLRGFNPDKELKRALRVGGQLVADDAKKLVSPYSRSIPPTIRVKIHKTRIKVEAGGLTHAEQASLAKDMFTEGYGGDRAYHRRKNRQKRAEGVVLAGLFEEGNKGAKSRAATARGKFRHPTFGHKPWRYQDMHPFLMPAAEKNLKNLEALEGDAVMKAFAERGI